MDSKYTLPELKRASADRMPTLSLSGSRGRTRDSELASSSQLESSDPESAKQRRGERMSDCEIDQSVLYAETQMCLPRFSRDC